MLRRIALASLIVSLASSSPAEAGDLARAGRAPAPGWLGVAMDPGGPQGVAVRHVVRTSPAEKGGVKEGDRIVKVDAGPALRALDVTRAIAAHLAGETVTVAVMREGREVTLKVTLEPRPSADEMLRMDHLGSVAPAWQNVTPIGAAPKSLSDLRGRVVVLDFWATWCGPCRLVAPKLSALQARFGAQGLTVVGVTTDEAETAAAFGQRTDMKYPIVVDAQADTSRAYGISNLPTLFVIDKRGVVRDVSVGFDPSHDAAVEQLIRTLLAEPAPGAVVPSSLPSP
jgi:peroxiredoxin